MTGGNVGNMWQEVFLVDFAIAGGTDIPFNAIAETLDVDLGEKDFEAIVLGNGGRLEKITPETPTTITIEGYPTEVGSGTLSSATAGTGFMDLLHQQDTTQPYRIVNTRARTRARIAMMWTNDTTLTKASIGVSTTYYAKRIVCADGFIISVKPTFKDGHLKTTVVYKVVPFDASGTANVLLESVAGTGTMTALQSYTATVKF